MGRIEPAGSLFLLEQLGSASLHGHTYTLLRNMNGTPVVQSNETGQTFHLDWRDILDLAVKAGVDKTRK